MICSVCSIELINSQENPRASNIAIEKKDKLYCIPCNDVRHIFEDNNDIIPPKQIIDKVTSTCTNPILFKRKKYKKKKK